MEVDYNPIVAPKEEPLEENNETEIEEDLIVEPETEPFEGNEIEVGDEVQSQALLSQVNQRKKTSNTSNSIY